VAAYSQLVRYGAELAADASVCVLGSRTQSPPLISGFSCPFVLVDQGSEYRSAPDPSLGKVGERMIGAWRVKS
jgi:hypothetical protein